MINGIRDASKLNLLRTDLETTDKVLNTNRHYIRVVGTSNMSRLSRRRALLLFLSSLSLFWTWVELRVIDFRLAVFIHIALHIFNFSVLVSCLFASEPVSAFEKQPGVSGVDLGTRVIEVTGRVVLDSEVLKTRHHNGVATDTVTKEAAERPFKPATPTKRRKLGVPGPLWAIYLLSLSGFLFVLRRILSPWYFDRAEDLSFFRLGFVGDTTATLALRFPHEGTVRAEYRAGNATTWTAGPTVSVSASEDHTASLLLTNLQHSTSYHARLLQNSTPIFFPDLGTEVTFRTFPAPHTHGRLTLLFGSCIRRDFPFPDTGVKGFRTALALPPSEVPDLLIFLGDTIYADGPWYFGSSEEAYGWHWRRLFQPPETNQLLATFPSVFAYDDHEILNDWAGQENAPFPAAERAFHRYAGLGNPASRPGNAGFFDFSIGDVAVFALDTRRYRSNANRTMLGSKQKRELKSWLLRSNSTSFKIVMSSVPVSVNWKLQREDTWACCLAERSEIFSFIKINSVRNVIFLSGDRHIVGVSSFPDYLPEMVEYSASPINQFYLFDAYKEMPEANDKRVFSDASSTVNWGRLVLDSTDPTKPKEEFSVVHEDSVGWSEERKMVAVGRGGHTADEMDKAHEARVFERGSESGESVLNFA